MPNEAESRVLARRTLQTTAPLFVAGPLIALAGLGIGSRIDNDLVFYGLPVLGITLMIAAVVLAKRATDRFSK
jgi:hypothetical protein